MATPKLILPESCDVFETRPFRAEDRPAWEAARDRQPEGRFIPDPEDPLNPYSVVVTRNDRGFAFGSGRLTAELFVTLDPFGATPAEKWRAIQELIAASRVLAQKHGLREMHAFIPTELYRYAGRLASLPGIYVDDRVHLFVDVVSPGTEG